MKFESAFILVKEGKSIARSNMKFESGAIRVQYPDSMSKMTLPYLYYERPGVQVASGLVDRVPWSPTTDDLFAEDWEIV